MPTTIKPHSILVFNRKPVGVRAVVNGNTFVDVEIDALRGAPKATLKQLATEKLISHGDLLVTQDELQKGYTVLDKTNDTQFCAQLIAILATPKQAPTPKPVASQPKSEPVPNPAKPPEVQILTPTKTFSEPHNLPPEDSENLALLNALTDAILQKVPFYLNHLGYKGFNLKQRTHQCGHKSYASKFRVQFAKGSIIHTRYPASFSLETTLAPELSSSASDSAIEFSLKVHHKVIVYFHSLTSEALQADNPYIAKANETIAYAVALILDGLYRHGTDEWEKDGNEIAKETLTTLSNLDKEQILNDRGVHWLILETIKGLMF